MKKIIVIGCGGSGKSTLARKLGIKLSLPVHHLDRLFWQPGWVSIDKEHMRELQEKIVSGEEWIMDGNYGSTLDLRLAACDTVIYLNYPTWRCLYGILKRRFHYRKKTRPDMTEGCNERLNWEFFRWVARFQKVQAPVIQKKIVACEHEKTIYSFSSPKQTEAFLQSLDKVKLQSSGGF